MMSFHLYPDGWGKDAGLGHRLDHAARRAGPPDRQAVDARRVRLPGQVHPQPGLPAVDRRGHPAGHRRVPVLDPVRHPGRRHASTRTSTGSPCTARARSAPRISNAGDELRHGQRSATRSPTTTPRRPCGTSRSRSTPAGQRHRLPDESAPAHPRPRPGHRRPADHRRCRRWHVRGRGRRRDLHPRPPGFVGRAAGRYTVTRRGRTASNVAELRVTVKPRPGDAAGHRLVRDRDRGLGIRPTGRPMRATRRPHRTSTRRARGAARRRRRRRLVRRAPAARTD